MSKIRKPHEIMEDIKKMNLELEVSMMHHNNMSLEDLEKLRIPDSIRKDKYFNGRAYYKDSIEKLVWEEDD